MPRRHLVTGGAGFIGSSFVRYVLGYEPAATVTNFDLRIYAGVKATIDELDADTRHSSVLGDIRDVELAARVMVDHDVIRALEEHP